MKSELVKPVHLARKAVVYIRQSTPHQVVSNQESLRLQYALGSMQRSGVCSGCGRVWAHGTRVSWCQSWCGG
jgi:hypothetical protein